MTGRKALMYAVSALALLMFSPVLEFKWFAGGGIILVGLVLIDVVQSARRRRR